MELIGKGEKVRGGKRQRRELGRRVERRTEEI